MPTPEKTAPVQPPAPPKPTATRLNFQERLPAKKGAARDPTSRRGRASLSSDVAVAGGTGLNLARM